jgi:hypothetical protein
MFHQRQLLMNDGDAFAFGIANMPGLQRFAGKNNFAVIAAVRIDPHSTFISVDLPEPFSPHSETTSPAFSRRLTLSTAFTAPKVLVMFFISSK